LIKLFTKKKFQKNENFFEIEFRKINFTITITQTKMSFTEQVNTLFENELNSLKKELINKGLDKKIISEVFSKRTSASNGKHESKPSCEGSTFAKENDSNSEEEPEVSLSKRRMGSKNTASEVEEETKNSFVKKDKYPVDWTKRSGVVIIENYSDKCHAIFGDFGKTYVKFKDEVLKTNSWVKYNDKLEFGVGWVIAKGPKDANIGEIRSALRAKKIPMKFYTKQELIDEITKKDNSDEESESSKGSNSEEEKVVEKKKDVKEVFEKSLSKIDKKGSQEPPEKKKEVSKKDEPKKDEKSKKVESKKVESKKVESEKEDKKIKKNKWNNNADKNGFVYMNLKTSKDKSVIYVVGYQNPNPKEDEKGLDTVCRLDKTLENEAKELGLKTLTSEILAMVKKHDSETGEKLDEMWNRVEEENEDAESEDDGNTSSESSSSSED
jgi:hypothetical protein